jgi:hypothetical protein
LDRRIGSDAEDRRKATSLEFIIAGTCNREADSAVAGEEMHTRMDGHELRRSSGRPQKNKKERGGWGRLRAKEKIWFGGTVQKSAVPSGVGECRVEVAECKMGRRRGSTDDGNVDWQGFEDFLKSFREKPGKGGISSACARLKRVKWGHGGQWDIRALVVFIIHLAA